jgi:hypothetical protein
MEDKQMNMLVYEIANIILTNQQNRHNRPKTENLNTKKKCKIVGICGFLAKLPNVDETDKAVLEKKQARFNLNMLRWLWK